MGKDYIKMDINEAVKSRRSIRKYKDKEIPEEIKKLINEKVDKCNSESGLNIQVMYNEPKAFKSRISRYGRFSGVKNYFAVIGKDAPETEEKCGYFGEQIVLFAQQLGLNTCWVGLTYKKVKELYNLPEGQKLYCVIAFGYGNESGKVHRNKSLSKLCYLDESTSKWFKEGMKFALLAPTTGNQQRFFLAQDGEDVYIKPGFGFYSRLDMGIVKYHFELGSNKKDINWKSN